MVPNERVDHQLQLPLLNQLNAPHPLHPRNSFAVVIQQLPPELRDAICVFYLVLRALDTVEDDMALDPKKKVPLLRRFYEKSYNR